MKLKSVQRKFWLWIACCAVLMNAIAPSISHALSFAQGKPMVWELCRADGTRLTITGDIDLADFASAKKQPTANPMNEDCGYCVTHAGSFGLPPSTVSGLPLVAGAQLYPFLFYRAPQPLAVWSAAQPRGPPAAA